MAHLYKCPNCGQELKIYRNPVPTVDVVIYDEARGIVLVERAHEPYGWALPGGFVEYGETLEVAAVREAREETGLEVELLGLVGVYSSPERDPRQHTVTTAYSARCVKNMEPCGGDDAAKAVFVPLENLPQLVFDHGRIIVDFLRQLQGDGKIRQPESGASVCPGCLGGKRS